MNKDLGLLIPMEAVDVVMPKINPPQETQHLKLVVMIHRDTHGIPHKMFVVKVKMIQKIAVQQLTQHMFTQ